MELARLISNLSEKTARFAEAIERLMKVFSALSQSDAFKKIFQQTGGASTNLYTGLKDLPLDERVGIYENSLNKLFDRTDLIADTLTKVATRVELNANDINKIKSKLGM